MMSALIVIALLGIAQISTATCPYSSYPSWPPCSCKDNQQTYVGQQTGDYDPDDLNVPGGMQANAPEGYQSDGSTVSSMPSSFSENRPENNPNLCVTHQVERTVRPVMDECVRHVPVVQKRLRHQEEQVTRHVPVVEKMLSQQEEKFIRHIPIIQKYCKPVIETRTRHIPVIKKRFRTVIEPYTSHIPILEKYTRPVEETVVRNIPIIEKRCRPIVHQQLRHIPITERRMRPILESTVCQIPIKQRILKNLVEQRIRAVQGPCSPCPPEQSNPDPMQLPASEQTSLAGYPALNPQSNSLKPSSADEITLPACGLPPFPMCPPPLPCQC